MMNEYRGKRSGRFPTYQVDKRRKSFSNRAPDKSDKHDKRILVSCELRVLAT